MGKVGRPKLEDSAIKAVRMPVRLWRLLSKASKEYRTRNELIVRLVEDHLLSDSKRKFPIEPKKKRRTP
jgi:hypothetical protein